MYEGLKAGCAKIFREISGLSDSPTHFSWSDERLLVEPLEAFEIDSLTLLEFVMEVESAYDVQLDEEDVNLCKSVGEFVALVVVARNGAN